MQLQPKDIQELKDILKKECGRKFTWEEATDAAYRLTGYAELAFKCWQEDERRKRKLEEFPKGFKLDGVGYTCFICGSGTLAGENWYDKYGIKCLICQGAVDRKEIPGSLAKNKETWYSQFEIERAFNVKGAALRRWIKDRVLKARTVTYDGKGVHMYLFLIKDNQEMLPPKKMVESRLVKETRDGKDWYHSEPWYRFVDPYEYLKDYRIMDYLRLTHEKSSEPK